MTAAAHEAGPFSVVLLAGGRGTRLGADKAALCLEGETLLERVWRGLAPLSDDLVGVGRAGQPVPPVLAGRWVCDAVPGAGVPAALLAGLAAARHPWVFLVGCDMPFVSPELVAYLAAQRPGHDAVVPRLAVGLEPLHAFYQRRCAAALYAAVLRGQHRIADLYAGWRVRYVAEDEMTPYDPAGHSFININTPEDLARARQLLACERSDAG